MITKIRTSVLAASVLALAIAAPASAEPNQSTELSASHLTFEWDGAPQTSISGQFWWTGDVAADCGTFDLTGDPTPAIDYCDQTLVSVSAPGTLDVALPEAGDGIVTDWDLYVYTADEDGNAGEQVGISEEIGAPEAATVEVEEAGTYLVVAVPYQSVNEGYAGAVTFTPAS